MDSAASLRVALSALAALPCPVATPFWQTLNLVGVVRTVAV
jgi:hypothetical protein